MSFGKMNGFADIVETRQVKDSEGFTHSKDEVLASIRVYREGRHGSQRWANLAAFSEATDLFRFRCIPDLTVTADQFLICATTLCPWRMLRAVECTLRYWQKRRCRPLAKAEMKMPEDFLLKISKLGSNFDSVADTVLQAGGEVVLKKVKSNLSSVIGRGTKFKSRTTGELEGALGLSPSKLNRDGNHDIKVGFAEPRSDGSSNAKLANILEYGKHGQPAKPFLKPAKTASRQECIDAMTKALDEEVEKL